MNSTPSIAEKILHLRGVAVLLDRDVAEVYGLATKRINEAVRNNPDKFPKGYCFQLDRTTKDELVENFDRFKPLKHSGGLPWVFTEKGLYMLATILKSKQAVEANKL